MRWLINGWHTGTGWHRAALAHAATARLARSLPLWLVFAALFSDFILVAVWFRCTRDFSIGAWAIWDVVLYLARLAVVALFLMAAGRHFLVPKESLGLLPSSLVSDLKWSAKCCFFGALTIAVAMGIGLMVARFSHLRLPPPPDLFVDLLGPRNWNTRRFITLAILAANTVLLAPITEELIYRSLSLPAMNARIGFYPAVVVTSIVFGMVHVIPLGIIGIPAPQIIGGLMMAVAFSIRWSIVPSIVLHGLGNLFVGVLCLLYVRLFEVCPAWFLSR